MHIDDILYMVRAEYLRASSEFPPFHSAHEGLAIIQEEFEELKTEVFKNRENRLIEKWNERLCKLLQWQLGSYLM